MAIIKRQEMRCIKKREPLKTGYWKGNCTPIFTATLFKVAIIRYIYEKKNSKA